MYDPKTPQEYAAEASLQAPMHRYRHRHRGLKFYFDLRADIWDGPETYHGIGWVCGCGSAEFGQACLEADAKARRLWE